MKNGSFRVILLSTKENRPNLFSLLKQRVRYFTLWCCLRNGCPGPCRHLKNASAAPLGEENEHRSHAARRSTLQNPSNRSFFPLIIMPLLTVGILLCDASSIYLWDERKRHGIQGYTLITKKQRNFVRLCSIYIGVHLSLFKIWYPPSNQSNSVTSINHSRN